MLPVGVMAFSRGIVVFPQAGCERYYKTQIQSDDLEGFVSLYSGAHRRRQRSDAQA